MAGKLTKEKLAELKEAFKDFDKDGSGTISAEEFRSFMKKQAFDHDENISDIEIDIQVNLCQKHLFSHQLSNPQYDKRLLIDLPVQYMKTTNSEHVVYINCSEYQNKNKKQFVYTTCSEFVVFMY